MAKTLSGIELLMLITLPSMEVVMQLCSTTPRQSLLPLPLAMSNWTSQPREEHLGASRLDAIQAQSGYKESSSRLCRTFLEIGEIGKRAA